MAAACSIACTYLTAGSGAQKNLPPQEAKCTWPSNTDGAGRADRHARRIAPGGRLAKPPWPGEPQVLNDDEVFNDTDASPMEALTNLSSSKLKELPGQGLLDPSHERLVRECLTRDFNSERFSYAETLLEAEGFNDTDKLTMQARLATTSSGTLHNHGLEIEGFSNTDESPRQSLVTTSMKKLHKHGSEDDEGISDTDVSPMQPLVTASMEEQEGFSDTDDLPGQPPVVTSAKKLHNHGSEDEGFSDTDAPPTQPLAAVFGVEEKFLYAARLSAAMPRIGARSRGMGRRPAQGSLRGLGVHREACLGLRAMMTLEDLARNAERAGAGASLGTGLPGDGRAGPGLAGVPAWASAR